jgi:hypothetical protein
MTAHPTDYLRRIWYDCITYDLGALRYLISVVGADRVLFGTDWPHQVHDIAGSLANTGRAARGPARRDPRLDGRATLRVVARGVRGGGRRWRRTSPAPAARSPPTTAWSRPDPDSSARAEAALPALNGNMSSYLDENRPAGAPAVGDDRETFLGSYDSRLHEAHGTVQKEYVDVPDDLLADTAALTAWFARSADYVAGLRPKPTTRGGSKG